MRKYKKIIIAGIVATIFLFAWYYLTLPLVGGLLALFYYPVVLCFGTLIIAFGLLAVHDWKDKQKHGVSVALAMSVFLTCSLLLAAIIIYGGWRYDRHVAAFDKFIVTLSETGDPPPNYCYSQNNDLAEIITTDYEIYYAENEFGDQHLNVRFVNDLEVQFVLYYDKYEECWQIYERQRGN